MWCHILNYIIPTFKDRSYPTLYVSLTLTFIKFFKLQCKPFVFFLCSTLHHLKLTFTYAHVTPLKQPSYFSYKFVSANHCYRVLLLLKHSSRGRGFLDADEWLLVHGDNLTFLGSNPITRHCMTSTGLMLPHEYYHIAFLLKVLKMLIKFQIMVYYYYYY